MDEIEAAPPAGPEKITLPSGGWVELRDPRSLRSRDKKAMMREIRGVPDTANPVGFAVDMADALIKHMITAWSLPYGEDWPIPAQCASERDGVPAVLDDMTIQDYDALTEAVKPAQALVFPAPVSPDDYDNPASPTPPAAG